ncbi:MAG: DinB family protein [Planctomycetota bacterium]
MDRLAHIRRSFAYDTWANREVLDHLESLAAPPARAVTILAHIIAAEDLWLRRIHEQPAGAVWPELAIAGCRSTFEDVTRRARTLLRALTQARLTEPVSYTNSKGEPWTSVLGDILMHVAMHGAYHRGQIALLVRESGADPAYTDYIHCVRHGFIE